MILGIRTDSSDDSCDNQVVTTVVDDDLEERIDMEDKMGKENNDIKEEDDEEEESSSDEYVPKTPTLDGSDGTVIEFNSISEYRQYQTKFDEENFGEVEEEVVCSQWTDESSSHMKEEERSSNEENPVRGSRKRKLHNSFDDASNSSVDKGSTSDEGVTNTAMDVFSKKLKLKDGDESEIEKESMSDEDKSIRSNSCSTNKQQLEEYQHESETEKGITSDEEQTGRSSYFSDKKMNMSIEENESEVEKGNTSDEEKSMKSHYFSNSKSKLDVDGDGSETEKDNSSDEGKSNDFDRNELEINECLKEKESRSSAEFNEDSNSNYSNLEQFSNSIEPKTSQFVYDLQEKHKSSSSSSKDSERSHHHHGQNESTSHHRRSKDKVDEENKTEGSVSSNSSKNRHESSRDRHKTRERKKSESSSSHSKSKHHDKNRDSPDNDRNSKDSTENDLRHKHHKDKPRDRDKEKRKHDSHDKNSERKKDHDSFKHGLISDKHSHRSSSERHKSDKEHKSRESSDKHRRHDRKSDKDNKRESKKKHREHCKTSKSDDSRRSTDRDSNGPSGSGHTSSSSKSSSTKSSVETSVDSGERTSSNSDNTVSDNVEVFPSDSCKVIAINTQGIASPDHEMVEDSWVESDNISSDQNESNDSYNTDQQQSDCCFGVKGGRISRSDKTAEFNRESNHESEARRKIDETELVQFEGVDVEKNAESVSSTHDNSSEKENIELTLDPSGNLSSPDSEGSVVKFKKPKIAANIYEVKKIMLARRKMKHMENKRMKLLTKTNKQLPSNSYKDKSQEEFNGFDEVLLDKKERYDVLIQRLTSEIESDEVPSVNPNLTTSWIDVSPDLDDYIENTLKGKVHRKIRVRLPPISDEYYRYDSELNAYIFLDMGKELSPTREDKVDGNLNNLEPSFENKEVNYKNLSVEEHVGTFNGSNPKPRNKSCKMNLFQCDSEALKPDNIATDISKIQNHNLPHTSKEVTSTQESEMKTCEVSALVSAKSNTTNPIIATPKVLFSLTYNETYKEILKEKNEVPIRTKTSQTVVKITNDRLSEQVVVKTVQPTSRQKYSLPTITKSEPRVNGQISNSNPNQNQTPFISRITKSKNVKALSSSTTKPSPVNGNISPDFTIKFEVRVYLHLVLLSPGMSYSFPPGQPKCFG